MVTDDQDNDHPDDNPDVPVQMDWAFPSKIHAVLITPNGYTDLPTFSTFVGGRSAAKSTSIAKYLVLQTIQFPTPIRILCCREFKNSIGESMHYTIASLIRQLGLQQDFTIQTESIVNNLTNSEFLFYGIKEQNIESFKSIEKIDITFIDEADTITERSWDVVVPTIIRKPGSKLIVGFNPSLATTATYRRWVVEHPINDKNYQLIHINYFDNPFNSPETLALAEREKLKDFDRYCNIWLGKPLYNLTDAIYANELRRAVANDRFRKVDYIKTIPCDTFWDLGRSDYTSIIIAQVVAGEYRIIDFIETQDKIAIDHIPMLRDKGYLYNTFWLPHDAEHKTTAARLTIREQILQASKGLAQSVRIVPNIRILDGINAVKTIFDNCYFDEVRCAKLIEHMRNYTWDDRKEKLTPKHDEHSHANDSLRYCALALRPPPAALPKRSSREYNELMRPRSSKTGWMNI